MVHFAAPPDFHGRGKHEPADRNVKPFTSETLLCVFFGAFLG
jgi:hypothetical protein